MSAETARESPRHGFRGNLGSDPSETANVPASLTIAISREAGARGATIAGRVGRKLGWQVYTQELLEYISQEGPFRESVEATQPAGSARWVEERLQWLQREQRMSSHTPVLELARVILALGAQGEVVLIGRGAGFILPPDSTLNVRIFAPREDRIAYMSQWLRLTRDEAAAQVQLRDQRRAEFLTSYFHRQPQDIYPYDLLLNSSLLGEDLCADLIAQAARVKLQTRNRPGDSASWPREVNP